MKFVNIKTSNVEGFTFYDEKIADHVLVLMVKGLRKKFKQPIAYYFTNALNKAQLKDIFKKNVSYVRSTGLKVVCD
uniref:SFRICE_035491 n=1 Tax=Spodoptera frugiperda TaxID=7108 RepID=A0A2H1W277_SPOFR